MNEQRGHHGFAVVPQPPSAENIETVYNRSGADHVADADGDPHDLFAFEGAHATSGTISVPGSITEYVQNSVAQVPVTS